MGSPLCIYHCVYIALTKLYPHLAQFSPVLSQRVPSAAACLRAPLLCAERHQRPPGIASTAVVEPPDAALLTLDGVDAQHTFGAVGRGNRGSQHPFCCMWQIVAAVVVLLITGVVAPSVDAAVLLCPMVKPSLLPAQSSTCTSTPPTH